MQSLENRKLHMDPRDGDPFLGISKGGGGPSINYVHN